MISIELLKQVKTIVVHDSCPDGLSSCMILHDALPDAEVIFAQHGKPSLLQLQPSPGMLFCDITPPPERADEFVAAGAIVLDHHIDKEALVAKFGERGVFAHETRKPGVSGAVLAFREVWCAFLGDIYTHNRGMAKAHEHLVRDFATLAGIRDTWQKSHPRWREALVAYHALTLHDWEHWKALKRPWLTADELKVGEALLKKRERDVEQCARNAWIGPVSVTRGPRELEPDGSGSWKSTEVARISLAIVNSPYELASDTSDRLRENQHVDLILAFRYEARGEDQVLRVSARSSERYDCSALAKSVGGGGHTRAAGFELHDDGDPFFMLMDVVRKAPQPVRP